MTIIDAAERVLKDAGKPLSAQDIHDQIQKQNLFTFSAKDPLAILRGTIRKHLRTPGPHRVAEVERGVYRAA